MHTAAAPTLPLPQHQLSSLAEAIAQSSQTVKALVTPRLATKSPALSSWATSDVDERPNAVETTLASTNSPKSKAMQQFKASNRINRRYTDGNVPAPSLQPPSSKQRQRESSAQSQRSAGVLYTPRVRSNKTSPTQQMISLPEIRKKREAEKEAAASAAILAATAPPQIAAPPVKAERPLRPAPVPPAVSVSVTAPAAKAAPSANASPIDDTQSQQFFELFKQKRLVKGDILQKVDNLYSLYVQASQREPERQQAFLHSQVQRLTEQADSNDGEVYFIKSKPKSKLTSGYATAPGDGGPPLLSQQRRTSNGAAAASAAAAAATNNLLLDGNVLDDITLKRALKSYFRSYPNSYLDAILESSPDQVDVPTTMIPQHYHVVATAPIKQGLLPLNTANGASADDSEKIVFNSETRTWDKLIFPTNEPTRRLEIYLLAKTMDDMLDELRQQDWIPKTNNIKEVRRVALQRLQQTFSCHIAALNEIVRQTMVSSAERGVILQRLQDFFIDSHTCTLNMVRSEASRNDDLQKRIGGLEKLMHELKEELLEHQKELFRVFEENNRLIAEKEELLKRSTSDEKLELIMRLLHNKDAVQHLLESIQAGKLDTLDDLNGFLKNPQVRALDQASIRRAAMKQAKSRFNLLHDDDYDEDDDSLDARRKGLTEEERTVKHKVMGKNVIGKHAADARGMLTAVWGKLLQSFRAAQSTARTLQIMYGTVIRTPLEVLQFQRILHTPHELDLDGMVWASTALAARLEELERIQRQKLVEMESYAPYRTRISIQLVAQDNGKVEADKRIHLFMQPEEPNAGDSAQRRKAMAQMLGYDGDDMDFDAIDKMRGTSRGGNRFGGSGAGAGDEDGSNDPNDVDRLTQQVLNSQIVKDGMKQGYDELVKGRFEERQTFMNDIDQLQDQLNDSKLANLRLEKELRMDNIRLRELEEERRRLLDQIAQQQLASQAAQDSLEQQVSILQQAMNSMEEDGKVSLLKAAQAQAAAVAAATAAAKEENAALSSAAAATASAVAARLASSHGSSRGTRGTDGSGGLNSSSFMDASQLLQKALATVAINSKAVQTDEIESHGDDGDHHNGAGAGSNQGDKWRRTAAGLLNGGHPSSSSSGDKRPNLGRGKNDASRWVKNQRLMDILSRVKRNGNPKSQLWLLKLVNNIYRSKIQNDIVEKHSQISTMPEWIFEQLRQLYGTEKLVDEYAGSIFATIMKYQEQDRRLETFGKFMVEEWDQSVLAYYLRLFKLLDESKIGPEYHAGSGAKSGNDDAPRPVLVSKLRCTAVLNQLRDVLVEDVIERALRQLDDKYNVVDEAEYERAMSLAGFKFKNATQIPLAKDIWGVSEIEAHKVITKAEFLHHVCCSINDHVRGAGAVAGAQQQGQQRQQPT